MKLVTDCKSGPRDGYVCPFVVEQDAWGWDDSKAWLLLFHPLCFLVGSGEMEEISQ